MVESRQKPSKLYLNKKAYNDHLRHYMPLRCMFHVEHSAYVSRGTFCQSILHDVFGQFLSCRCQFELWDKSFND